MSFTEEMTRKAQKLLRRPFRLNAKAVSEQRITDLREGVVPGVNINKDSAYFVKEGEAGREFMAKPSASLEYLYGDIVARVLSKKKFALKRTAFYRNKEGRIVSAIKWDKNIVKNFFLADDFSNFFREEFYSEEYDKTIESFARLCGVIFVLGEHDHNNRNYLFSTKTGRIVKIDNSLLANGYFEQYGYNNMIDKGKLAKEGLPPFTRMSIYGSVMSKGFFRHVLAGRSLQESRKEWMRWKENIKKSHKILKQNNNYRMFFSNIYKSFDKYCSADVGDCILDEVKENLRQNDYLRPFFKEFAKGVENAIELSRDQNFLDALKRKFRRELGENGEKLAQNHEDIFKNNAKRAQKQFAKTIAFCHELEAQEAKEKAEREAKEREMKARARAVKPQKAYKNDIQETKKSKKRRGTRQEEVALKPKTRQQNPILPRVKKEEQKVVSIPPMPKRKPPKPPKTPLPTVKDPKKRKIRLVFEHESHV